LKNELGGDLIDDGLAGLGGASRLVEMTLGGEGRHAFVPQNQANVGSGFAEGFGKGLHLLGGGAFGAVHVFGQTEDDGVDLLLFEDLLEAREGAGAGFEGFEGMGEHPQFIGEGEAEAGITGVDSEGARHGWKGLEVSGVGTGGGESIRGKGCEDKKRAPSQGAAELVQGTFFDRLRAASDRLCRGRGREGLDYLAAWTWVGEPWPSSTWSSWMDQ
jgi:hypothetical protein